MRVIIYLFLFLLPTLNYGFKKNVMPYSIVISKAVLIVDGKISKVSENEYQFTINEFLKGKSMVEIRESISNSPEAVCINSKGQFNISSLSCSCPTSMVLNQNKCIERSLSYEAVVRKAFSDILKRAPLQAGLDYYVGLLKSGYSEQFIRNEIASSAEGQCVKLNKVFQNGQCL